MKEIKKISTVSLQVCLERESQTLNYAARPAPSLLSHCLTPILSRAALSASPTRRRISVPKKLHRGCPARAPQSRCSESEPKMEECARRRLALLSSHVNPPAETSPPSSLSASACASSLDGNGDNDCVFCKIIRGEAPALKLYEDDECLCILDTYPLCHGHALIIPKSHFPSLDATPPSVREKARASKHIFILIIGAMCSKVPLISNAVMKATGCDSFNVLVNNGAAAGQVIYHTHIHIIPRKAHDCLWTSESIRRRPLKLDEEAAQLADRVRESLTFTNSYEDSKGQGSSSSLVVN